MPTYGYQCTKCKHQFDVFQAMKDEPVKVCPDCGAEVKRLLYPVGVVFKGSGWYITDSRKPEPSESKPADTTGEKKAEKPAEGSGDKAADTSEKKAAEPAKA